MKQFTSSSGMLLRRNVVLRVLLLVAIVTVTLLLSGCARVPLASYRCPGERITYPPELIKKAAEELAAMPEDAATPLLVSDYDRLLASCRAMEKR